MSTAMWTFDPFRRLYPSYPAGQPLLGWTGGCDHPVHARRRGRPLPGGDPEDRPEVDGHGLEAPGRQPPPGLLVHRRPRREVVGQEPPRATGLDQPPEGVEHLPEVVLPLPGILPDQCQVPAANAHSSSVTSVGYGVRVVLIPGKRDPVGA